MEAREGLDDMMDAFRHLGIEKKNLSGYKAMGEAGNGAIYSYRRKGRFCLLRVSAISKKNTWGNDLGNKHHLDEYTNACRALHEAVHARSHDRRCQVVRGNCNCK